MIDSLPPTFPGRVGQVITILQLIVVATSYSNETNAQTRAQYSKFSSTTGTEKSPSWPSKLAMLVIYTPALIASVVLLMLGSSSELLQNINMNMNMSASIPNPSVAAYLCAIHFLKRVAEVLFLHSYSGRTDRGTPTMISVYYTFVAILISFAGGMEASDDSASVFGIEDDDRMRMMAGITVFAIGILGNFYHHYLLAKLRVPKSKQTSTSDERTYIAPNGGLFSFVAAPHYLFELVGWAGIAIVSDHLNVYLVVSGMTSYLAGRSVAQNDFNRIRFKENEWPRSRKNLIPGIF